MVIFVSYHVPNNAYHLPQVDLRAFIFAYNHLSQIYMPFIDDHIPNKTDVIQWQSMGFYTDTLFTFLLCQNIVLRQNIMIVSEIKDVRGSWESKGWQI